MIDRVSLRRRLLMLVCLLTWLAFMLYPDPRVLAVSLKRLVRFPIDAQAVREVAADLPDSPAAVEAFARDYVPYEYAWKLYGVPWYFPTVQEVLRDKAGDCQASAVLQASILEAKGLPYTVRYSFDHVWIDYPGKTVTSLEDPQTSFVADEGKGWFARLPDRIPLREIVEQRVGFHWAPMPVERKAALFVGVVAIFLIGESLLGLVLAPFAWAGRRALGLRRRTAPEASEA